MSLIQLPKVIDAVNELATKVQKLEQEVKKLKEDAALLNRMQQTSKPTTKKND
jgi:cell division septum initiation protein DivIVA